jgi:hypothetical protein
METVMTNRHSRSELKDLVIDALLGHVDALRQLGSVQTALIHTQTREAGLREDLKFMSQAVGEFAKEVPDFITKANLAQNGPPDADVPAAATTEA